PRAALARTRRLGPRLLRPWLLRPRLLGARLLRAQLLLDLLGTLEMADNERADLLLDRLAQLRILRSGEHLIVHDGQRLLVRFDHVLHARPVEHRAAEPLAPLSRILCHLMQLLAD